MKDIFDRSETPTEKEPRTNPQTGTRMKDIFDEKKDPLKKIRYVITTIVMETEKVTAFNQKKNPKQS